MLGTFKTQLSVFRKCFNTDQKICLRKANSMLREPRYLFAVIVRIEFWLAPLKSAKRQSVPMRVQPLSISKWLIFCYVGFINYQPTTSCLSLSLSFYFHIHFNLSFSLSIILFVFFLSLYIPMYISTFLSISIHLSVSIFLFLSSFFFLSICHSLPLFLSFFFFLSFCIFFFSLLVSPSRVKILEFGGRRFRQSRHNSETG
jgi:hypothetical protein